MGEPVGIVVIPDNLLPDKKARMCAAVLCIDANGNPSYDSPVEMAWSDYEYSGSLPFYPTVLTTSNDGSTTYGLGVISIRPKQLPDSEMRERIMNDYQAKYANDHSLYPYPYCMQCYNNDGTYNEVLQLQQSAMRDINGKSNTIALNDPKWKAAYACLQYSTPGTNKGDWYLPALGELVFLAERDLLHSEAMGAMQRQLFWYYRMWSSTLNCSSEIWLINQSNTIEIQTYNSANYNLTVPFALVPDDVEI